MSYLSITQQQALRGHRNSYSRELAIGPVSLATLTILMGFVLSLFYLSQSNRIATRGYEITSLQTQASDLRDEQSQLELQAARLQSVQTIRQKVTESGTMVPVTQTSYLGK